MMVATQTTQQKNCSVAFLHVGTTKSLRMREIELTVAAIKERRRCVDTLEIIHLEGKC